MSPIPEFMKIIWSRISLRTSVCWASSIGSGCSGSKVALRGKTSSSALDVICSIGWNYIKFEYKYDQTHS